MDKKEELFTIYYSKLIFNGDQRITFTEAEAKQVLSLKNEMKSTHDQIIDIVLETQALNETSMQDKEDIFLKKSGTLTKKLEKLEKEFISIQQEAEHRFMLNHFGDDAQSVLADAKFAINEKRKKFDPLLSIEYYFEKTKKLRFKKMFNSILYLVRMHSNYLYEIEKISLLVAYVSTFLKEYDQESEKDFYLFREIEDEIINDKTDKGKFTIRFSPEYEIVRHSLPLSLLAMLNSKKDSSITIQNPYDKAVIEKDGLVVYIDDFKKNEVVLNCLVLQFIDMLIIEYNDQGRNNPEISFSVKKYMERRGIKTEAKARKQINEISKSVSSLSLKYSGDQKSKYDFNTSKIVAGMATISNGQVKVILDEGFCEIIKNTTIMYYPKLLFTFNEIKNPNSYYLLRKISWHKNINFKHKNTDVIKVDNLLKACPNLPRYEDISESGQIRQRIIRPFEKGMDSLDEVLNWNYFSKNTPLSKDFVKTLDYSAFSELMIHISWINFPVKN